MHIKSIVAGAAIALAAATSLASASDELSPQGGVPGESPSSVPNTGRGILGLSNENFSGDDEISKLLMRQKLMREYFLDPSADLSTTPPPPGGSTPTTPDPIAARNRVIITFPNLTLTINGSKVVKNNMGKRTFRIKLPSGKIVTEGITIMQTEDGTIYGIGAGLHNFGSMHESRNQPFPDQTQYSFDEDPIPRPAPTPSQSVEAGDQDTVPSGGYNFPPRISNVDLSIESLRTRGMDKVEPPKIRSRRP